ncbi:MAG TPA: glycine cleavage system protein GcvH [Bdellovibrionales bacterium]|nr:glycine cleavage system protein GcvH [Bdellovibrionales bacterium]
MSSPNPYNIREDYYYTKEHEWAQVDENIVTVGITEYAQKALGEIVYIEFPEEGQKVNQNEPFGVVESVKAVSDLYAPVSGTVIEVNSGLLEDPGPINDDPMNDGWLIRIEMDSEKELVNLIRAPEYIKLTSKDKK